MRFYLRYRYSNDDLTSFRYAQCAEFILQGAEFAARMDEKFSKCKMPFDCVYAYSEKSIMVGITMFANDPCLAPFMGLPANEKNR
jgi:hypothetical protein